MDLADVIKFATAKGHLTNTNPSPSKTLLNSKFGSVSSFSVSGFVAGSTTGRANPTDAANLLSLYNAAGGARRTKTYTVGAGEDRSTITTWAMVPGTDILEDIYSVLNLSASIAVVGASATLNDHVMYDYSEAVVSPTNPTISKTLSGTQTGGAYLRSLSQLAPASRPFYGRCDVDSNVVFGYHSGYQCYNAVTSQIYWTALSKAASVVASTTRSLNGIRATYRYITGSQVRQRVVDYIPSGAAITGSNFIYTLTKTQISDTLVYDAQSDYDLWLSYEPITKPSLYNALAVIPVPLLERFVPRLLSGKAGLPKVTKR